MRSRIPLFLFRRILSLALLALPCAGQTHYGKDFYLVDPYSSATSFTIAIANPNASAANVTLFNVIEGTTNGSVPPGAVSYFTFPDHEIATTGSTTSTVCVYHVTSNIDVAVFVFDPLTNQNLNDACVVLPVPMLGQEYRIGDWMQDFFTTQYVLVVCTSPIATNVQVIDSSEVVVDNVTLLQGQCFSRLVTAEMTGWAVVGSRPISVFSGSSATYLGPGACCADELLEQLLPTTMLAQEYPVAPLGTRPIGCTTPATCAADVFRFVATVDGTTLATTPNVGGGVFNEGDFLEIATATPFVIAGDQPFFGYQYLPSNTAAYPPNPACGTGDPSLLAVLPVEQFRRDYLVAVPSGYPFSFLNVIAPFGTSLLLDNAPITPAWDLIGTLSSSVSYGSMRIPVTSGTHSVSSPNQRFGLVVSGLSVDTSYAYLGGLGFECTGIMDGWMRDVPGDDGTEPDPSTANMWQSPDIWVRHQQDTNLLYQHQHQNPLATITNYVYVKLRNRGCNPLESGTLSTYFSIASTGQAWSTNWIGNPASGDLIGSQPVTFIAAGGDVVLEFPWIPPVNGPYGILARFVSGNDPMTFAEGTSILANAKNNNNIAWRNMVTIEPVLLDPLGSGLIAVPVVVRNVESTATAVAIELGEVGLPFDTSFLAHGTIRLTLPADMFQAWQLAGATSAGLALLPGTMTFEVTDVFATLSGIPLAVGEEHSVALNFAQGAADLVVRRVFDPFVIRQRSAGSADPDGGVTFEFKTRHGRMRAR